MVKKDLNIFSATKMIRKIDLFVYVSQKMTACRKNFDETKFMSFLIEDDELLEKYNKNCGKVKDSLKREFDSKSVYNKKYLKAK